MQDIRTKKSDVLKFRNFSRKGYALFACLGKVVIIGVLSVATLQNAKAEGISADTNRADNDSLPTSREYDLDEVEVSGTRAPMPSGQSTRMVTVLQAQDIQASAAQNINDLLKLCTGVDVRQRAPLGAQTDISIRGGTSEHIAILLNGICISDPQTGHNTLDLPVQLSEILRIEVLEGPAARAYGAQSLLGAINIVTTESRKPGHPNNRTSEQPDIRTSEQPDIRTSEQPDIRTTEQPDIRKPENPEARKPGNPGLSTASLEAGSFGFFSANAVTKLPEAAGVSGSLSASYSRSDGFSRAKDGSLNNDYEGNKLYYQGSFLPKANGQQPILNSLTWSFGLARKRWGSSTSYGIGSDSQYEQNDKYFANISSELIFKDLCGSSSATLKMKPAVYWQQNNDRYQWRRGISTPNRNTTNIYGANLNALLDWTLGKTAAGVELRNEDLISSNMPNTNRTNLSLHFEHNITVHRLSLSAGFLGIKNSFNNMPLKFYPGVDASLKMGNHWKLYASWNRSMRLPTFTELYYKVDGHLADPHLQPEEMEAFETGVRYASKYGQSSVSLYRHHGKNMIDWTLDTRQGADAVWTSVNHTEINSYGVETQNRWRLSQLFPSQKILKTLTLGYNYIHQSQEKEEHIQSLYALEYLRHKVVAGLTACLYESSGGRTSHPRSLNLSLSYRFQDRIGEYTDAEGVKKSYRPYSIFDARLDWKTTHYTVYVSANNLFSKRFIDYGNIRQPGVWVIGGVSVRM